jgi:hypothetical protein
MWVTSGYQYFCGYLLFWRYNESRSEQGLLVNQDSVQVSYQCYGSGFNGVPGAGSGIRIQEGKNVPQKKKISFFEVLDVLF